METIHWNRFSVKSGHDRARAGLFPPSEDGGDDGDCSTAVTKHLSEGSKSRFGWSASLGREEISMKSVAKGFCTVVVCLVLSTQGLAWNKRGHMMIAAITYDKLTPAKKTRVAALLVPNPDRDEWFKLLPN